MLSAVFVDRPRLAIVIAIVTTIAGLVALFAIPIAQYPDIVPPQVSVSTSYPGASGAVVDATMMLFSSAGVWAWLSRRTFQSLPCWLMLPAGTLTL